MVDTEEIQGAHVFTAKPGQRGMEGSTSWPGPAAHSCMPGHKWQQKSQAWEGPSAPGLHAWPSAPSVLPHRGL